VGWVSVLLLSFPITQFQIGFEWMEEWEKWRAEGIRWWGGGVVVVVGWGGVGFRFGPRVILMPFLEVLFYFLVFFGLVDGRECVWEFFFFGWQFFCLCEEGFTRIRYSWGWMDKPYGWVSA